MDWTRATGAERAAVLPGDELLVADVVMDRGFDLAAPPESVWPWLVQLGKRRAGWYLPASVERLVPASRRALRHLEPRLLEHEVGDVVPDWGGADATFTLAAIDPPRTLLYTSRRGSTDLTWVPAPRPDRRDGRDPGAPAPAARTRAAPPTGSVARWRGRRPDHRGPRRRAARACRALA